MNTEKNTASTAATAASIDTDHHNTGDNAPTMPNPLTATDSRTAETGEYSVGSTSECTPDMMSLLAQSSVPTSLCAWLKCLRAPGMSLRMNVEKRCIPDVDAERARRKAINAIGNCATMGSDTGTDNNGSRPTERSSAASNGNGGKKNGTSHAGGASDASQSTDTCGCGTFDCTYRAPQEGVMRYTDTCTIRYFDLAVGAVLVLGLGCMIKCLMGCKKCMKKWF